MAGSAGRVTGAHIWAFVFGILFIVFLAMWYMQFREREELVAAKKEADSTASTANNALRDRIEEIEALISMIGHEFDVDQIGVGELDNQTKVLGAMQDDIQKYGGNVAQETYNATIVALRNELDNTISKTEQLQDELEQQRAQYLALQDQYNTKAAGFQTAANEANSNLQDYVRTYDEMIASKDEEITELRANYAEAVLESEQRAEAFSLQLKAKDDELSKLNFVNTRLREQLDQLQQISFEKPDATITNVDNATKLVWLNIGSRDNLQKQITFSVYDKNNKGVGRSQEDIKAQIEVTRVWEDRAEARILKADLYRPITPGDVVYSPLWESGRTFYFSFVGFIDLDGDGIYDRELLHDIVESSGAEIDNEVGDDGEWLENRGVTSNTKFVVIGEIPDPTKTERDEEKEQYEKIVQKRTELVNEARLQGTRVVSLNDFLAYIGFKPQRRLYVPGLSDKEYTLKAGAQSKKVNEMPADRRSTGRVSDIFNTNRTGQKTSSGRTSGAFSSGSERGN
ncbi:MAG: hypothetical protein CMJ47_12095 [Planctomyces sp.]|uniref:Uncharacterized protein n=1 Tax=Rubinisphaera brasiliensis (strain ATCC 49424 / DSM 5305 / JCM 21570 / IAM 15109 / NBRC 103401 / IFAM 1448) TaxID=756272 RepID=F0STE9_RUBBR|nr:hypothetical protein [Rubinisphaera brasiliensis]ADY60411.1 hypothetical protein Plabr_2812 [Rubinisphaera brasiliensis DSM 5305]MBB03382.1 hypothetical protein [Planctomyces sp.]